MKLLQILFFNNNLFKLSMNRLRYFIGNKTIAVISNLVFVIYISTFVSCNHEKPSDENLKLGLLSLISTDSNIEAYDWNLPTGFPVPVVPNSNPMSQAKVELGRFLFYDTKLSGNQTQSCASCHLQSLGFTDGNTVGIGSTGALHPRNPQALSNMAYLSRYTWMNSNLRTLEQQARLPLFGTTPVELGLDDTEYLNRIKRDTRYLPLFQKAFRNSLEAISEQNIRFAISSFQRSLISGNSSYDKYYYQGNSTAMTSSMLSGMNIFNGEVAKCSKCHTGFNFTDSTTSIDSRSNNAVYHDNGNKSTTEYNSLELDKRGLVELTEKPTDTGKFRTPSLRNIALTYPYMHDGSFHCDLNLRPNSKTYSEACAINALEKVIDHYMSGGKTPSNKNTNLIRPFSLTNIEKQDLINFLLSLTDQEFISNPKFSNPF